MADDENRGIIRNRKYANQIKDFSGLRYGKITPTDIDGLIDFGNRAFVTIELKYSNNPIPTGQKLAIERLTDALDIAKIPALALVASHIEDGDIDVADCVVTEYRFGGMWHHLPKPMTVRQVIDVFLKRYAPRYVNEDDDN